MTSISVNLSGYSITEQIYAGTRTLVYRGIRETGKLSVILKLMRKEFPSFNDLVQFRNQYTISKNLDITGVVKPLNLETYQNGYVLVMEDFKGISLKEYAKQYSKEALPLAEFLDIAIKITSILNEVHRARVIHKDIKPTNILINPHTKQIKLIDFSIASRLPKETQTLKSPHVLKGTLAYLSPEQTGRMNRGIDYRSDLYSLGVSFYELLTGQLPFTSYDVMELVYCHIAKQPVSVDKVNPDIPIILAEIINKLMLKNAEDRYQSLLGLKHDLTVCLSQLQEHSKISNFLLATKDISDRFRISEKLYGRENEVEKLLAAFNRVAKSSKPKAELMLVAGFSGIGKTAVVNEVHKPILKHRGYFIRGKFEQFQHNIPLSAFVQAFRDLMEQLLSESDEQIAQWKAKILEALGENAQVIIEVIPKLELIIGKQYPVTKLSGTAEQNRFNLLFNKFLKVFTNPEHPLVIFLDDLQWADSASLQLMKLLMSESERGYLLLMGAYRDSEVYPAHPLMLAVEDIKKVGATVNMITLASLTPTDINHLIADTLNCPIELAQPLAELVHQKAKGNPFFTTQFLKLLYDEKYIHFDFKTHHWWCDIGKVRELAISEDVVEFLTLKLQKFPKVTQNVLKLAACIGNQFDLATLAIVNEKSQEVTASDLWKALQEGLVIPTSEIYKFYQDTANSELCSNSLNSSNNEQLTYKFLHDRVQQAAYSLIKDNQKQIIHLRIGQLLLNNSTVEEREEKLFEIVGQLNQGLSLITNQTERDELTQLNLVAGQKAKLATAYSAAIEYFKTGIELLLSDCWQMQYELTLTLYESAAEAAYLNGNYEQMDSLIEDVLHQAKTLLDKIKVYKVKIQARIAQNQQQESLNIGLSVLEQLGIPLEKEPPQLVENIEGLIDLPELSDPHKLAAMDILTHIVTPAWTLSPKFFKQTIFTMVDLSIKYGNCPASTFGYAWYGTLLCELFGEIEAGYDFGLLALKLLDKFDAKELRSSVNVLFATHIGHWKEHTRMTLPFHLEGVQRGLETGNLEYASYGAAEYCQYLFLVGEPLEVAHEKCLQNLELIDQLKQSFHYLYLAPWLQGILNLKGEYSQSPTLLIGTSYDETEHLQKIIAENQLTLGFVTFFVKALLSILFEDYAAAVEFSRIAYQNAAGVFGTYFIPTSIFYSSLALLADYPNVDADSQQRYIQQVTENLSKLRYWAVFAPTNYQHKCILVEAERSRILGHKAKAIELYDRAIALAKKNEYLNEEALANELAAKFYLKWGKISIAQAYMLEAYRAYERWGALAKVQHLQQNYPLLSPLINQYPPLHLDQISSTNATNTSAFDSTSILKASQTIAQEIKLDTLLAKIMTIVIENAGAERGYLILQQNAQWYIVASGEFAQVRVTVRDPVSLKNDSYDTAILPHAVLNYVIRTQENLVLNNAVDESQFTRDAYIRHHQPKSVLCLPLLNQGKLVGILYLENNLITGAFTPQHLEVLRLLSSHMAISIENATLYNTLEHKVKERTQELSQTLIQLQQAQAQLIQSEKISSLGQIVAGIAHEINNPISFIYGNLKHMQEYVQDILQLLYLYQEALPTPSKKIAKHLNNIDLEFLVTDLPLQFTSMEIGAERIRDIVQSLRNFSRFDEAEIKPANLHEGLDSTLLLLQHRLEQEQIDVIKQYGHLPKVTCYPAQLNQAFMNILTNAIDALYQKDEQPKQIIIQTEQIANCICIRIQDNGVGIPLEIQSKIFDPFFTTKPVGKGTGLGLFTSYQIITEKHSGSLECVSSLGEGATFAIRIPFP